MAYSQEQIDKVCEHYLATDKASKSKSAAVIGISAKNSTTFFRKPEVQQRIAQLEIEAQKNVDERSKTIPEPLTKKEFQALLLSKINDKCIKEETRAKYVEMYGKTNGAFSEKIEIEGSISLSEILLSRRKNKKN